MSGWTATDWRYFLPTHSSASPSMRYFGVRANSLCLLNSASNTARVLLIAQADADRHQERQVLQPRDASRV